MPARLHLHASWLVPTVLCAVLVACTPPGGHDDDLSGVPPDAPDGGVGAGSDAGAPLATDAGAIADAGASFDGGAAIDDGGPHDVPDAGASVPVACANGADDDSDGWIDGADPDCHAGQPEAGLGQGSCNDGRDNDSDGATDAHDPDCHSGSSDEALGDGPCSDRCPLGSVEGSRTCTLWDARAQQWIDDPGQVALHHRARAYEAFLRAKLMPQGGIFRAKFADATLSTPTLYAGSRDSPIWTGTFLAAKAMEYRVTGAPDALDQVAACVRTLHRWWSIAGDRGMLARYAAPTSVDPVTLALLPVADDEVHATTWDGAPWRWRGNISRDQYQGAFLGYSFAYEVLHDEELREVVRHDVVETLRQLMSATPREITFTINGVPIHRTATVDGVIYSAADGEPGMVITTSPFEATDVGLVTFWPNTPGRLREIMPTTLGWLPDFYQRGQAIQLGGMFAVGLQVTEGVPGREADHAAIRAYYEAHVEEWAEIGAGYTDSGICGGGYHGKNIAFTPALDWVRLEHDPARRLRLQRDVLRDGLWDEVADHKNVWFALIYASQAAAEDDVTPIVDAHLAQLALFPTAPNVAVGRDLRDEYPLDDRCDERAMSTVALDVDDRIPTVFMWERNPWNLVEPEDLSFAYPGHDFLIAYWMARNYGFLDEDTPDTCLLWR